MAVTKAKYRRFYGLDSEKGTPPTGTVWKNMDEYFATDNSFFYVRYNNAWIKI